MVTALIVVGVVLFLAVDAYVLYRVLASRRSADEYGAFNVPGEATVAVPVGKLKLTYQESYRAPHRGDRIDFGVPRGLRLAVVSPAGEELELRGPGFRGMGASLSTGGNLSRALIGTVEVSEPGAYTVSATLDGSGQVGPQILIGK